MIIDSLRSTPGYERLADALPRPGAEQALSGLAGSAPVALAAALVESGAVHQLLLIAPSARVTEEVEADLEALLPGRSVVFPQREAVHPELDDPHVEISARRVEALQTTLAGRSRILVTSGRALGELFALPSSWTDLEIRLATGQPADHAGLIESLEDAGYRRVPMVEAVGEYSVRGGIVDIYPVTTLDPVRIEFWGDEIESIRSFDVLDQRSIAELQDLRLLPVRFPRDERGDAAGPADDVSLGSLLDVLPESMLVVHLDLEDEAAERERSWTELARRSETPQRYQRPPSDVRAALERFARLRIVADAAAADIDFGIRAAPEIDRRIDRLIDAIREALAEDARVLILCDNEGQLERLEEILTDAAGAATTRKITLGLAPPAAGFVVPDATPPLWLFTDHEIFRRARRPRRQPRTVGRATLETLSALTPGDFAVHLDHGIGRYRGLERVSVGGEELETLVLEYAGGDILRVPHYRADLVERWMAETGDDRDRPAPRLHRLGGKSWSKLKKRTEQAIQTMAAELLELYARRRVSEAHAFAPDTRWQREMQAAFIYDETPDQERVAQQVKLGMEGPRPMDRLICGDVGFGKTEIAIRAAFKAVQDGKQVAVLAPTTVLVEQHLATFRARLADYPVVIESLSRFRTRKQQEAIIERLAEGSVDIVIGTHRLVSPDVPFKDLGLLVIDEEQQFGVAQKEHLKALRQSVDVITMTATPIPRTLHLSLSGLRDLAVIRTPPSNRQPIITHMITWEDDTIADAIRLEVDRGGQVFFVHNRVESIQEVAARVRRLVPDLRVEIAHGQMPERQLEKTMTDFVRGDIHVLVATAIIENGLDLPNANTMIIHRADYFGLAQLYQLRGRVGRSHHRAFCYLVVPHNLPLETERRLQLLEQHTELGAGYRLALKDLELRGAGNLLGAEQSGFAQAVGFDAYLHLLEDTVAALRAGQNGAEPRPSVPEVSVSGASYIPDDFIPDPAQKLDLYRRLSKVADLEDLEQLSAELRDRFGPLPAEVERLIAASRIRILGGRLGVERVLATAETARINFRRGSMPKLTSLREAMAGREVEVEVRRLQPLSLLFRQPGARDVTPIVVEALERILEEQRELVRTG
ncbi:MAG: transcription-repair coupling factor [Gemmatimonadetes bacterium]|uniref:Transcription-repair-coupling factor n=1 Tax=Candidatus Kutchimonas denitrificans TaxID=3056748 RepID=A0AAE4ZCW2_9BACT|nr:transcription-repair coupling factor [Gemmatimonadota bacterium]NIR75565.1 transcription-repair coupling factor [Candidatus Kutchimonas denitrificans]NIS01879.1 transcription-repair coupling factor [Gemmatimonadota bacterium]NIT67660.1 transcription-repair coupling factor [Gemmatimonadota bacterium]NIU53534.1 transcription-repair coupling factor [Gemmatimonadota bacterium]